MGAGVAVIDFRWRRVVLTQIDFGGKSKMERGEEKVEKKERL